MGDERAQIVATVHIGEWFTWNGGVCPVPIETTVEYRLRWQDGNLGERPLASMAGYLRWDRGRTPESAADDSLRRSDIVAYRIVDGLGGGE